jgi:hypothetical protein
VVSVCGQPKQDIQLVSGARAMVSAVMSRIGMTSGQQVNWLTAVRQYLNPADIRMGPTRAVWTCRNCAAGGVKSPNGVTVAGDFGALAGLASPCVGAAIILHAWPHKTLCDQFRCCFGA